MIRGFDVSAVQPRIDWAKASLMGFEFVVAKCSEGNKPGTDAMVRVHLADARMAGKRVGTYHFAFPLPSKAGFPGRAPADQARIAFDKAGGVGGPCYLPPTVGILLPSS